MTQEDDFNFWRFGNVLHDLNDDITREPLPRRWFDLINNFNEKERMRSEAAPSGDKTPYTGVCLVGDIPAARVTDVQVTAPDGHSIPLPLDQYLQRNLWPSDHVTCVRV